MKYAVKIGRKYIFAYPWAFVTLPDYSAHHGKVVKVTRQATNDEVDPRIQPQYWIESSDGWEGIANPSELDLIPSDYKEPQYTESKT